MNTWIGQLEEKLAALTKEKGELEKLRPVLWDLDRAGIPGIGRIYPQTIYIEDAGEEIVPKLMQLKNKPVQKHFSDYNGSVFYYTKIRDFDIYVYPDKARYVCKMKRIETTKQVEETSVKFELENGCDPLMMEEAE